MRMLLDDGKWNGEAVLPDDSLRTMWRPHTSLATTGSGQTTEDFRSYGLGWFLYVEHGQKLVEHDGGMPGFLSKVSLIPADRFGFVVLNNGNDGVLNEVIKRALLAARAGDDGIAQIERLTPVAERIRQRAAQEVAARTAQRREHTAPSRDLGDYVGRYVDEIYGPAEIARDGDTLRIALLPSKARLSGSMMHWHDDTFRVDFPDRFLPFALVRFEFDSTGRVDGFGIDCPIADFDFGALDFRRER
jgi:hypothetical protein